MVATHGEAGLPHACERKHLRPESVAPGLALTWTLHLGLGHPYPQPPGVTQAQSAPGRWKRFGSPLPRTSVKHRRTPGEGNKK